jgi:hypothetical protein
MTWIIIGLISFIIQIYVLKHTYTFKVKGDIYFDWEKAEKVSIPLWAVLIMLITSITPFVSIIEVIVFWVIWLKYYSDPTECCNFWYTYWRFKDKIFSRKI